MRRRMRSTRGFCNTASDENTWHLEPSLEKLTWQKSQIPNKNKIPHSFVQFFEILESNPVAVVDDPLQAVLDEAQRLMESLGSSNNVALSSSRTASFAIDSDDDDDFLGDVPLNATVTLHPLDASISLEHQ
jgi:hypothetical protein